MAYIIETFPCENGSFMRWARMDAPSQPSKGCVLIGMGWGEWLEKYSPIAEEWHTRGFDCVVLEWRGQGLSSPILEDRAKGYHASLEPLIDDIDAFVAWFFKDDPGPLFILAHSMGAHLMLRWYLERNPPLHIIKGVMLLSIMQEVNTEPFNYPVAELIAGTATFFGLGKHYAPGQEDFDPADILFPGNRITRDEARYNAMILAMRDNPLLKSGGITFGWLNATFQSARKLYARLKLGAPRGPYLVLGPQNDPLVSTLAMKRVASYLPNCTSVFYPGTAHELLQETDAARRQVWEAIDTFVAKALSASN